MGLTETDAGSDLKNVVTEIVGTSSGLRVHGHKSFISNGVAASFFIVFGKEGGGFSLVLVPAGTPGVHVTPSTNNILKPSDGRPVTMPTQDMIIGLYFLTRGFDTATGETALIVPPFWGIDEMRWSAGLRRVGLCTRPDEPVYLYRVTFTADGNAYPVLHFQDPNQAGDVTGYNVYRTSTPGLPHFLWSLVADDVVDMDAAEPNKQWVDTTGDVPPGGVWYYSIAAYNHACPADSGEGPW